MSRLFTLLAAGTLLCAVSVDAHHSFSAEFDGEKPVILRGKLTKMEWVNPHGWLYVDVTEPDGTVVNWHIEAGGPNALIRRGLRKTDFPIGSDLVIEGYQAKNGSPVAAGRTVRFVDGRNFFLGASDGPPAAPSK